jgi:NAD-dependent DNA ligase
MNKKLEKNFPNPDTELGSLIKRRRLQILVHSCIYYEFGSNIITDSQFDAWCRELVELLRKNPKLYSDRFDRYFENWDGVSGFDFPHRDPWIWSKAESLLQTS